MPKYMDGLHSILIVMDAYLPIPVVRLNCILCILFGRINDYNGSFAFWLAVSSWDFTCLTIPILFLCWYKAFCIVYLGNTLGLIHSMYAVKWELSFICYLFIGLGLHFTQWFCLFRTSLKYGGCVYLFHLINYWKYSSWLIFFHFRHNLFCVWSCSFRQANFYASGHAQLHQLCHVIQSKMLTIYQSLCTLHRLKWLSQLQQCTGAAWLLLRSPNTELF